MPEIVLRVGGENYRLECEAHEMRRLEDLAASLEARLARFPKEVPTLRRLVLTAVSLLDEAQASGAAVARAHAEIDRLQDILAEACLETEAPGNAPDGRVLSLLRHPQGAA